MRSTIRAGRHRDIGRARRGKGYLPVVIAPPDPKRARLRVSEAAVCSLWGRGDRGMTFRDEALESMRWTTQPPCPRCGKRMTLTRVDPHTPGYETRTFDCSHCGYSVGEVVKIPSPEP
jgi:hypothetical protein